ncbi:MAG: Dabb family protein [Planctomycetes bacterium]|nr:Dabb family protein [Planctomycetota bacterium]
MIHHVVLLKLRRDITTERVKEVFAQIGSMKAHIPGLKSYHHGPYSSPEGLNKGFTHGFTMTFDNAASRDTYLWHPEHEKVKAAVLGCLDGGLDGVVAFDFES